MIPRDELLRVRRLASRANPRVKEWAGLSERGERERLGLTLAEGAKLVREALVAGDSPFFRPNALLVSDSGAEQAGAGELFRLAEERGVERFSLSDDCFAKVSGLKSHDGLALAMAFDAAPAIAAEDFSRPGALWVVAAGVQDPGNAGALARIALAAGAAGCLFLEGADPRSPKFLRGSMGAAFRLPCPSLAIEEFMPLWRQGGARLVAASTSPDAPDYRGVDFAPPVGLLVGGERGIPDALAKLANASAHIPLRGGVESLNLAVAAGIILFQAAKK